MATKKAPSSKATSPVKTDWEAIERDYRTGKFTLRELESKYGVDNAQIARRKKKCGWAQDLTQAVRQATNAKLIEQIVSTEVSKSQQSVSNTVLAAAELNKQVILGHRGDIKSTRDVAFRLLNELAEASLLSDHEELLAQILAGDSAEPGDVAKARQAVSRALSINSRVSSIKALAETFSKLQASERVAFGISDDSGDSPKDKKTEDLLSEFAAGLHSRSTGRLPIVPPKRKDGQS